MCGSHQGIVPGCHLILFSVFLTQIRILIASCFWLIVHLGEFRARHKVLGSITCVFTFSPSALSDKSDAVILVLLAKSMPLASLEVALVMCAIFVNDSAVAIDHVVDEESFLDLVCLE